jgi:hypothetical protein
VLGYLFDGHEFAQFVNIPGQALSDPKVGMEKFQVLDEDPLTLKTKDLAIVTMQPDLDRGQIQIPHSSFDPAVDVYRPLATDMANRVEPLVGNHFDPSLGGFEINRLVDNSYSRKGEVFCYTQCGHRWPPGDDFLAGKQVYYPLEIPDVHYCLKS